MPIGDFQKLSARGKKPVPRFMQPTTAAKNKDNRKKREQIAQKLISPRFMRRTVTEKTIPITLKTSQRESLRNTNV